MQIPENPDTLGAICRKILFGFLLYFEVLKLPKSLGKVAGTAVDELDIKDAAFRASSSVYTQTISPALIKADEEAKQAIADMKKIMRLKVSHQWNAIWGEAGFATQTTKTPATMEGRRRLLEELAKFLAKHPNWESTEPEVSATILASRAKSLQEAMAADEAHDRSHKIVVEERAVAGAQVRARLRSLINELEIVLSPDDARWADFGLESPAEERARKPARQRKSESNAEAKATGKYEITIRKAETAKSRAEKIRVRADKALVNANLLRAEAEKAMAIADLLFAKANEIAPAGVTLPIRSQSPRATQPSVPARTSEDSVELVG